MHYKLRDMSCGDAGRSRLLSSRTISLVIGLLMATAQGLVPEQQDALVERISMELEASMQSSVLSELQAAAYSVGEGLPIAIPDFSAKTGGVHGGIPDSSAIVGQVFQLRVPPGPANASCNLHVSTLNKTSSVDFMEETFVSKIFNLLKTTALLRGGTDGSKVTRSLVDR